MKILVLLVALCGSVLGGPQVPHQRGSSGADSGGSSDNAHAPRIAQSLSNIYDILGDRAKGLSECQFPFTYMGKTYTQCTTDHDYYGMYWCSTRTNDRGEHAFKEWRHCQVSDGTGPAPEKTLCEDTDGTCKKPGPTYMCSGRTRHRLCGDNDQLCCIERPNGCTLGGTNYPSGDYNRNTCLKVICINGEWVYTGEIREECKMPTVDGCYVDGDPHVYMFDNTTFLPGPPPSNNAINKYKFRETGTYVISQNTLKSPTFRVTADFKTCNTQHEKNLTCIHSIGYYEQGMPKPIELVLPKDGISPTNPPYCSTPEAVKKQICQIAVYINGTKQQLDNIIKKVQLPNGNEVLIIKHNHIRDEKDLLCVNIVGTQGISVSLCEREDDFANLYVFPMETLKDHLKLPNTELYGLCNTYTGKEQTAFTTQIGATTQNVDIFGNSWKCRSHGSCP